MTGVLGAIIGIVMWMLPAGAIQPSLPAERWHLLWIVCALLAAIGSWVGNILWNAAQKRLPLTLSGQMIAFETLRCSMPSSTMAAGRTHLKSWPSFCC